VNRVVREYRQYTPEEKERISRGACPQCGRERLHFNPGNEHAICCQASCSMEYWFKVRATISLMRRRVRDEQGGKCALCRQEVHESGATEDPDHHHHYVLDHIRPIAMGGDQWARDNLQVLCGRCNRIKTAGDMGRIARWKKYHCRGLAHRGNSRQVLLFRENVTE
jgi:5-methylcytosine-specific restriction endonuclease McrA